MYLPKFHCELNSIERCWCHTFRIFLNMILWKSTQRKQYKENPQFVGKLEPIAWILLPLYTKQLRNCALPQPTAPILLFIPQKLQFAVQAVYAVTTMKNLIPPWGRKLSNSFLGKKVWNEFTLVGSRVGRNEYFNSNITHLAPKFYITQNGSFLSLYIYIEESKF